MWCYVGVVNISIRGYGFDPWYCCSLIKDSVLGQEVNLNFCVSFCRGGNIDTKLPVGFWAHCGINVVCTAFVCP